MIEVHYKLILGILSLLHGVVRAPHAKIYKKTEKIRSEGKRREQVLVIIAALGMMVIPFIWILSSHLDSYAMNLPDYIRLFGIVLGIICLWMFHWVHTTLGQNWSPILEIRKDHTLIKDGPYKYVRHPMYTQIWLWIFSQLMISSNWFVGLGGIITWAILYFIRVGKEEQLLEEQFGQEYIEYKQVTGRIIPKMF